MHGLFRFLGRPLVNEEVCSVDERMLKWFAFEHLPEPLRTVSGYFHDLAVTLCTIVDPGPERTVALRKLLEAKDAAVRAKLHPGG